MVNLDSQKLYSNPEIEGVLKSIILLPDQVEQAWNEVTSLEMPEKCSVAKNVVIAGMGGSALGGRIVDSLTPERSRTPIEVFTEYHLPNYVSKDTLVIISSYSGNTEETLTDAYQAIKKNATIFAITTGGKLADLANSHNLSSYIFRPKYNPSGQPRMALGYSIGAIMAILAKCNFIHLTDSQMKDNIKTMKEFVAEFDTTIKQENNIAKKCALKLHNKVPIIVSSEHLVGSSHAFKNQLNETAKTFSVLFDIPELNHHLMEGLSNPKKVKEFLHFYFFESDLYTSRVQKRYSITKQVVEKNSISFDAYHLRSKTKLEQIFEVLVYGSFVQLYLALMYEVDPSKIPWVDYFKKKLA